MLWKATSQSSVVCIHSGIYTSTMSSSKPRCPNFTPREQQKLLDIVEQYVTIIENKRTNTVTVKEKMQTWEIIAQRFNSAPDTTCREARQLRRCYENLKKRSRKVVAQQRAETIRTGGGGRDPPRGGDGEQLTTTEATEHVETAHRVAAMLVDQFAPNENAFDSDAPLYNGKTNITAFPLIMQSLKGSLCSLAQIGPQ